MHIQNEKVQLQKSILCNFNVLLKDLNYLCINMN